MAITKQTTLNEFLVRWDDAGQLQGAHLVQREAILEDGAEISSRLLPPAPVALTDSATLATIAAGINAAALAQIDGLTADKHAAEAARDAALAQVTQLTAQLAQAATPPPAAPQPSVDASGVPTWVYATQAYLALIDSEQMDKTQAALAAIPGKDGALAQAWFTKASIFYRDHPLIAQFIASGVFTAEEMDALFKLAATFPVDGSPAPAPVQAQQTGLLAWLKGLFG